MLIMLKDNYLVVPRRLSSQIGASIDNFADGIPFFDDYCSPTLYFPCATTGRIFTPSYGRESLFSTLESFQGFCGILIDSKGVVLEVGSLDRHRTETVRGPVFKFTKVANVNRVDRARFLARSSTCEIEEAATVAMDVKRSDIRAALSLMDESIQMFRMDDHVAIHVSTIASLIHEQLLLIKDNSEQEQKDDTQTLATNWKEARAVYDRFIKEVQEFSWETFEQEYLPTTYPRPVIKAPVAKRARKTASKSSK